MTLSALVAVVQACHTFPNEPEATRWESPPDAAPLANVSGRVTSGTTPVADAIVWINEVRTTSDGAGNYNLAGVRGPLVLVFAAKVGYDTTRVPLNLSSTNITLNLTMQPSRTP
ncbi:MAG: hypothetical protein C0503_01580 [Gemmatimonas sp.]|nr:hypothetical protein [Gemmatimonas sp.]